MNYLKKTVLALLTIYLVVCTLVWLASPTVSRMVLGDLLATYQLELDENSSVRLNLFNSCLSIENLKWRQSESEVFRLDELEACYSLHRLLVKQAYLNRLTLDGLEASASVTEQGQMVVGIDLNAQAEKTAESTPEPATTTTSSELPVELIAPEIVFRNIQLKLNHQGQSHLIKLELLEILNSQLIHQQFSSELNLNLLLNQARISLQAQLQHNPERSELALEFHLTEFDPAVYHYLLPQTIKTLSAQLGARVKANVNVHGTEVEAESEVAELTIHQLSYADDQARVQLNSTQAKLTEISLSQKEQPDLKANLLFELEGLRVDEASGLGELLSLEQIAMAPAQVNLVGKHFAFSAPLIELLGIQASKRKQPETLEPLAQVERVAFKELELTETSLALSQLGLGEVKISALRDATGAIASLVLPKTSEQRDDTEAQPSAPEPVTKEESAPFTIRLDELVLNTPAQIEFTDLAISPEFRKKLTLEKLQLTQLDSSRPEQESPFELAMKDEDYFQHALKGVIQPFKEKLNIRFESRATEFPLHQISPYIRDALGFDIQAGQLDSTVTGGITDDELDTKVTLLLRGATFDSSAADSQKEESDLIGKTAVPLDIALGMLKDDEGNIKLKLPIDGHISDPNFGMQYIIGLIAKKAVMSQAKDYLITTFLPYAQVIKVGMVVGSYALKVRFDDLEYAPLQIEPVEPQQTFMQQFQQLLMDKPDLQVKVCGVATPDELGYPMEKLPSKEQQQELLELAKKRGEQFKKRMVENGVKSSRLLLCVPSFETKKEAKPRLKLSV